MVALWYFIGLQVMLHQGGFQKELKLVLSQVGMSYWSELKTILEFLLTPEQS